MPEKETSKGSVQSFRRGVIVFSLLLALIVGTGVYLFLQANDLNSQYTTIEETLRLN